MAPASSSTASYQQLPAVCGDECTGRVPKPTGLVGVRRDRDRVDARLGPRGGQRGGHGADRNPSTSRFVLGHRRCTNRQDRVQLPLAARSHARLGGAAMAFRRRCECSGVRPPAMRERSSQPVLASQAALARLWRRRRPQQRRVTSCGRRLPCRDSPWTTRQSRANAQLGGSKGTRWALALEGTARLATAECACLEPHSVSSVLLWPTSERRWA